MVKNTLKFKQKYLAIPYLIVAVVFTVIPLAILLVNALTSTNGGFTLENFTGFFTREGVMLVMLKSLLIAGATTVLCVLIAYPVAMILANPKFNKNMIFVLLFILPMYINSLLRTYAIKSVFDMIGLENSFIRLVIALTYDFFPFMLLPIYTVIVNLDKSYLEASNDLGGGAISTFTKVTLPLSVGGIVSGCLMVFMPTISTFAISEIVLDSTDWYLFGNLIESSFSTGSAGYGRGAAYSFILLIMILGSMFITNRVTSSRKGGA